MCKHCDYYLKNTNKEVFVFCFYHEYNIDQAKQIVNGRKPIVVKIDNLRQHVDYPRKDENKLFSLACSVDEEHIDHVPDIPIIMAYTPAGVLMNNQRCIFPIDGHHRIAKNIKKKRKTIRAYVLTIKETDSILRNVL